MGLSIERNTLSEQTLGAIQAVDGLSDKIISLIEDSQDPNHDPRDLQDRLNAIFPELQEALGVNTVNLGELHVQQAETKVTNALTLGPEILGQLDGTIPPYSTGPAATPKHDISPGLN